MGDPGGILALNRIFRAPPGVTLSTVPGLGPELL